MPETVEIPEIMIADGFDLIGSHDQLLELEKSHIFEIGEGQAGEQVVGEVDLDQIRVEHVLLFGDVAVRRVVEEAHVSRVGEELARVIKVHAERAELIVAEIERPQKDQKSDLDLFDPIERQIQRVQFDAAHVQMRAYAQRGDLVASQIEASNVHGLAQQMHCPYLVRFQIHRAQFEPIFKSRPW